MGLTRAQLSKLTVPKLKDMLRLQGAQVTGRKSELVDRLLGTEGGTPAPAPMGTAEMKRFSESLAQMVSLLTDRFDTLDSRLTMISDQVLQLGKPEVADRQLSKLPRMQPTAPMNIDTFRGRVKRLSRKVDSKMGGFIKIPELRRVYVEAFGKFDQFDQFIMQLEKDFAIEITSAHDPMREDRAEAIDGGDRGLLYFIKWRDH